MIKASSLLLACLTLPVFGKGPPNDHFANARELSGEKYPYKAMGSLTDKLDRFRATREEGEPNHAGTREHGSVWYTWKADRTQKMRIFLTTVHREMQLVMAVYTGKSVDEPFTRNGYLQFDAIKGTNYYIAVSTENEVFKPFQVVLHTHWNRFRPQLELLEAESKWEYLLALDQSGEPVDPKLLDPDFYKT